MAWTQADLDRLKKSMVTGILEFQSPGGTRTKFQSLDEMRRLEAEMIGDIESASTSSSGLSSAGFRIAYSKGI